MTIVFSNVSLLAVNNLDCFEDVIIDLQRETERTKIEVFIIRFKSYIAT
jgi:hypothetical protein